MRLTGLLLCLCLVACEKKAVRIAQKLTLSSLNS